MPIELVRNDITRMRVDAIVNAANSSLLGGGGVDGAIHHAAGPGLLAECRLLGGCPTGEARITGGYRLPCRHVIHTVGPVWRGGSHGEEALLRACYRNSLALARAHKCESIAFPLISAGAYGYPRAQALSVAMDCARDFLLDNDMLIYIVVFDRGSFRASERLYAGIAQYIDDVYASEHAVTRGGRFSLPRPHEPRRADAAPCKASTPAEPCSAAARPLCDAEYDESDLPILGAPVAADEDISLRDALSNMDETFTQMLLRKIDERGMTDTACYKRANIDRKLFSKIRSDAHYRPSKRTALSLAIALRLSLDETRALLAAAGLALSHSIKADIIVEYCILHGIYDIDEVNRTLFDFDQSLLGA
ncbi:MAG: O-acetyl-ADP-ribose deacetylase [Candidatus Fimadaptatus sp.]